jgi:adenylate cyclase
LTIREKSVEPKDQSKRKLAAIMFTDMAGYTVLGQKNEALSLALVEEQRNIIRPILRKHKGREIKTIGDAFFVEFSNALDAVRCAYDIQRATREFNFSLAEERRVHLRIGVHLGDVVESDGDISGDAVNIASRIEQLADKGGVCLTREVYAQVSNKFDIPLVSLGPKSLKNVRTAIEVFKMSMPWEGRIAQASSFDKSRIAVLPFANMSPDPNDEYFADGMTEELISTLSRIRGLKVIARTSVMGYKGSNKKIREIGNELEVGTILEGSVRKAGNKVRITAQLIDIRSEEHLWASNYDRTLDDIFGIQSDVASKVAGSLPTVISPKTEKMMDTEDLEAYTLYLRAVQLIHQETVPSLREAIKLLERAVSRDPGFARAYASLSMAWQGLTVSPNIDMDTLLKNSESAARKAVELGPDSAEAHASMAFVYAMMDRHGDCAAESEIAVQLNPNLSDAYMVLGMESAVLRQLDEALNAFRKAYELNPLSFDAGGALAFALSFSNEQQEALTVLDKLSQIHPMNGMSYVAKARILMSMHEYGEAQKMLDRATEIEPDLPLCKVNQGLLFALTGKRKEAEETLAEIMNDKNEFIQLIGRMHIQSALGNLDDAAAALERMAAKHIWDWMILYSPLLAELRADKRFEGFCNNVGIPIPKR